MKNLMTVVVSALCAAVAFTSVAEMTRQKNGLFVHDCGYSFAA